MTYSPESRAYPAVGMLSAYSFQVRPPASMRSAMFVAAIALPAAARSSVMPWFEPLVRAM